MSDCCKLVGNFFEETSFSFRDCFISVNNNVNTDLNDHGCDGLSEGASIGSLNISGYAGTSIYTGCQARAGVQVLWMRKFRCDIERTHFIFLGPGRSFMQKGAENYVDLYKPSATRTSVISASAQSGPSALFSSTEQIEGLGMGYSGGPIAFNTSSEDGCTLENLGLGVGDYYLQNFNIELVPGSIPIASYTFAYNAL